MLRLVAAVVACTVGLAFWWGLTEPLPVAPTVLFAIPAVISVVAGVIAGRLGVVAAPVALLFSLFLGSILATQLHQAFVPSTPPVSRFGGIVEISPGGLVLPLAIAAALGLIGGVAGERLAPRR